MSGKPDISDKTESAGHEPGEDRRLLRDEERGKGEPDDNSKILGSSPSNIFSAMKFMVLS